MDDPSSIGGPVCLQEVKSVNANEANEDNNNNTELYNVEPPADLVEGDLSKAKVVVIDSRSTDEVDIIPTLEVNSTAGIPTESEDSSKPHSTPEVLTSFSRSAKASSPNVEQPFFQPSPQNFFDSWPTPFHYLPLNKQEKPRGFNLVKFVTAGVTCNLKTLGVEELDCKEFVESWLTQRHQRRWTQSLRRNSVTSTTQHQASVESHPCVAALQTLIDNVSSTLPGLEKLDLMTIYSPSKPNSSLLRLSGEGSEELNHFFAKMEDIRAHLNNATCTLLQTNLLMMLPYVKLLSGHQLDCASCHSFVQQWIELIVLMAKGLGGNDAPSEAKHMIAREFREVRSDAKKLHKTLSRIHRKIQAMFAKSDYACKKALGKLHPKSATSYKGRDKEVYNLFDERLLSGGTINFPRIPLHKASIGTNELFRNHIFVSQSPKGELLVKKEIDRDWETFSDLPYITKQELFLSVVEDLRWTLRVPRAFLDHVKLLCDRGYPESVRGRIDENMAFLKEVAKQDDLLVLSKVTIVTQVNCMHEAMTRLLRALKDGVEISKYFSKTIKSTTVDPLGKRLLQKLRNPGQKSNSPLTSQQFVTSFFDDDSKVKLVVPFPISTDPFEDQFFLSSV